MDHITITQRLTELEATISQGLSTFIAVGEALQEIRDQKLYRAGFPTFEEYCRQRWGMKRAHAYRLVDAAQVVNNLSPIGDILPTNEAQTRALGKLPPQLQREVWPLVVETAPAGKITAAHVERVVSQAQVRPDPNRQVEAHARNLVALEKAAGGPEGARQVLDMLAEQELMVEVIAAFNRVIDSASVEDLRQIRMWLEDFELDNPDLAPT